MSIARTLSFIWKFHLENKLLILPMYGWYYLVDLIFHLENLGVGMKKIIFMSGLIIAVNIFSMEQSSNEHDKEYDLEEGRRKLSPTATQELENVCNNILVLSQQNTPSNSPAEMNPLFNLPSTSGFKGGPEFLNSIDMQEQILQQLANSKHFTRQRTLSKVVKQIVEKTAKEDPTKFNQLSKLCANIKKSSGSSSPSSVSSEIYIEGKNSELISGPALPPDIILELYTAYMEDQKEIEKTKLEQKGESERKRMEGLFALLGTGLGAITTLAAGWMAKS